MLGNFRLKSVNFPKSFCWLLCKSTVCCPQWASNVVRFFSKHLDVIRIPISSPCGTPKCSQNSRAPHQTQLTWISWEYRQQWAGVTMWLLTLLAHQLANLPEKLNVNFWWGDVATLAFTTKLAGFTPRVPREPQRLCPHASLLIYSNLDTQIVKHVLCQRNLK